MSSKLNDLKLVLEELHNVRKKWYEIGLQLSTPVEDLESILSENKNDQNVCLRRVLMIWLKSGKANWPTMCEVLTNRTIDEMVLAEQLRQKHVTSPSTKPSGGRRFTCTMYLYTVVLLLIQFWLIGDKAPNTIPQPNQGRSTQPQHTSQTQPTSASTTTAQQATSENPDVRGPSSSNSASNKEDNKGDQSGKCQKRKSDTPAPSAVKVRRHTL